MPSILVTAKSLPYAHRLHGYCGRCARVHGHNARIEVVAEADALDAQGFVVDFFVVSAALSNVLAAFDHSLILHDADPLVATMRGVGEHVVSFRAPPTAEHLARYVLDKINDAARLSSPPGRLWRCTRVTWQEEEGFIAVAELADGREVEP